MSGRGSGYVVVVPPGVRHLPELLSVTESTFFHGDMRTRKVAGVREIFGVPVILTNINLIKQIEYRETDRQTDRPDSLWYRLRSGCVTWCPASPRAAVSHSDNISSWEYKNKNDVWYEGDV